MEKRKTLLGNHRPLLPHPDVQTARIWCRKYIPCSSQRNFNWQQTGKTGASSLWPEHGCAEHSTFLAGQSRFPSAVQGSSIRNSFPTGSRVNIILKPGPGRCLCGVSHCVRTSPAAQRDEPSRASFHLFTLSIVIQMAAGFRQRGAKPALPPLSLSDSDTLASAAALHCYLLRCSACTLNAHTGAHRRTDRPASGGSWPAQNADWIHRQHWSWSFTLNSNGL